MTDRACTCFRDVIALWPNAASLSVALHAEGCAVGAGTIKQWRRRDAIPAPYFAPLIRAASNARHFQVTAELLVRLAAEVGRSDVLRSASTGDGAAGAILPPPPETPWAAEPAPAADPLPAAGAEQGMPS